MSTVEATPKQFDRVVEKVDIELPAYFMRAFGPEHWPSEIQAKCWGWTGHIQNKGRHGEKQVFTHRGYGRLPVERTRRITERPMVWFQSKLQTAQKALFRLLVRELAEYESLRNRCGNRMCVNPTHYRIVYRKTYQPVPKAMQLHDEDVIQELAEEIERIYAIHQPGAWAELYDHFKEEFSEYEVREALKRVGGVVEERCSPVVHTYTELSANH